MDQKEKKDSDLNSVCIAIRKRYQLGFQRKVD